MSAPATAPPTARARGGLAGRVRRWRPPRPAVGLSLLALVVIVPGMHWGIPHATAPDRVHAWGNDDQVPLAPLAEMYNTFVAAQPNRNVAYPWGNYALVAAAYTPYLTYLLATGDLRAPAGTYPFGLRDPAGALEVLSWIGRAVSVLFGVVTVLGAWYAARVLWGETAGLLAGAFTLLLFPLAYYARVGNPDIAALGWTSLGLAAAARCVRQGISVRRGVWLGLFVAMAGASKDQALASFVLVGPALTLLHVRQALRAGTGLRRALRGPTVALGVFLGASLLAHGILVDPGRWSAHAALVAAGGTGSYLRYPQGLGGTLHQVTDLLVLLKDVLSWPGVIAATAGLVLAVRRDRPSLVLALAALAFFVLLIPVGFSRIHYLLPVALPLALFGGYAVAAGLSTSPRARALVALGASAAAVFMVLRLADLTHDMIRDSRYAAGAWLAARLQPGDDVLSFGAPLKLPHLPAGVPSTEVQWRREARPALAQGPAFVLVIPEDTNEDRQRVEWRTGPHSVRPHYLPGDVWEDLVSGAAGYRLVARFQTPRLMPWLPRPFLSYPVVNPPVHVFARADRLPDAPSVEPWAEAPYYPPVGRVDRLTVDYRAAGRSR